MSLQDWNISLTSEVNILSKLILRDSLTSAIGGARVFAGISIDKYLTNTYSSPANNLPRFILSEGRGPADIVGQAAASLMTNYPSYGSSENPLNFQGLNKEDISVTFVVAALFSFCDLLNGEKTKVSGQQFWNALYIGLEIPLRLQQKRPNLNFSSCVSVGIVSMGSYLLKLNPEQQQASLDLALNSISSVSLDGEEVQSGVRLSWESGIVRRSIEAVTKSRTDPKLTADKSSPISMTEIHHLIETREDVLMMSRIYFKPCLCHSALLPAMNTLEYLIAEHPEQFHLSELFQPAPVSKVNIALNQTLLTAQNEFKHFPSSQKEEYVDLKFQIAHRLSGWNTHDKDKLLSIYRSIKLSSSSVPSDLLITVTFNDQSTLKAHYNPNMMTFTEKKVVDKYYEVAPAVIGVDPSRIIDENINNLSISIEDVQSLFSLLYGRVPWD